MAIILLVVILAAIGIPIWAITDIASRPEKAFRDAGSSKVLWICLVAIGTIMFVIFGLVFALVYLISVRPRVAHQTTASESIAR